MLINVESFLKLKSDSLGRIKMVALKKFVIIDSRCGLALTCAVCDFTVV